MYKVLRKIKRNNGLWLSTEMNPAYIMFMGNGKKIIILIKIYPEKTYGVC